jgi:hypothetical protein
MWGIKMNSSREMYAKTYGRVDVMDHPIKNLSMIYHSLKYWHLVMLHANAITIVAACSVRYVRRMRVGKYQPTEQKPMSIWRFREQLSIQVLQYDPQHRLYPSSEALRKSTQQSKAQRKAPKSKGASMYDSRGDIRDRGRHPKVQLRSLYPYV